MYRMKSDKTVIMWIPREGTGTIRSVRISPRLIKIFVFVIALCIIAVPVLETGILNLRQEISTLRQHEQRLNDKIMALHYIERNLAAVEEKDTMLRHYFGLEKYKSLEPVMIGGGDIDIDSTIPDTTRGKTEYASLHPSSQYAAALPQKLQRLCTNHEVLGNLIIKQEEARKSTPSIMPVNLADPKITSDFGWRKNPFTDQAEFHSGIDVIGPKGTQIIAPADGVVITIGHDRWLGRYLVLQHTKGIKTIYGHFDTIHVKKGEAVKRGHPLGTMGNTGMSTSRHLHYTVVVKGRVVDPMQFILNKHRS